MFFVGLFIFTFPWFSPRTGEKKNVWTINFFLSFFCSSFSQCVLLYSPKMCRFVAAASYIQAWWKFVRDENRSRSGNSGLQMIVETVIDKMCYTFWHRSAFRWQREGNRKFSPCLHIIFASTSFKDDVGCLSEFFRRFSDTFFRMFTHADMSWRHCLTRLVFNVHIRQGVYRRTVGNGEYLARVSNVNLLMSVFDFMFRKYSDGLVPTRITVLLHLPIKSRTNPKQRLFNLLQPHTPKTTLAI